MVKKGFVFVLLILALSPFTEPFQADSREGQHVAALEPLLSGIRRNADLRALTPGPLSELERVETVATISEFATGGASTALAEFRSRRLRQASPGDDFALATPLRL